MIFYMVKSYHVDMTYNICSIVAYAKCRNNASINGNIFSQLFFLFRCHRMNLRVLTEAGYIVRRNVAVDVQSLARAGGYTLDLDGWMTQLCL